MLNFLRFWKPSCTIVLFLVTALALPAAAQTLAPSEIDALKAQLVEARDVFSALGARVQCYDDKDDCLQDLSSKLQQKAGDLYQQELTLSSELAEAKSNAEEFSHAFEAVQREIANLQRKRVDIYNQILKGLADLADCKGKLGILGFLCDLNGEFSGLHGSLRKISAESRAAGDRVSSLQEPLGKANIKYKDAEKKLQEVQLLSEQNKQDIEATEAEIKVIKASLAEIRTVKQDYSTELVIFQDAFTEFEGLDPKSDRRSVVHRLLRESADLVDAMLVKARSLLDENGLQLPNGERICAN